MTMSRRFKVTAGVCFVAREHVHRLDGPHEVERLVWSHAPAGAHEDHGDAHRSADTFQAVDQTVPVAALMNSMQAGKMAVMSVFGSSSGTPWWA